MGLSDQILGGGGSEMGAASSQRQSGAGGLGNILGMGGLERDSRSAVGAGVLGGLGSLVEKFTQKSYGTQANSWVGTGPNEALSPHAVREVFGEDQISRIAQQADVSKDDAHNGLSELLPGIVDHLTPAGRIAGP